jgi:hypothetical protein
MPLPEGNMSFQNPDENQGREPAQNRTTDQTQHAAQGAVSDAIATNQNAEWWKQPEHIIQIAILLFVGAYTVLTLCLLLTSRDTERRQLRAYLGFPNGPFIHKDEEAWYLETVNGGQTPAHKIAGRLNMAWKAGANQVPADFVFADFPGQWSDYESEGYILPQKSLTMKFALRHLDIIEKSKTGEVLLIVYGHVDYWDVFNSKQTCEFAYYSVPSNAEFGKHIQLNRHNDCS